jgi:hypothetical protein
MEIIVRTTLSLDDHVLAEYKKLAAKTHRTLSAVIQDALLEALSRRQASATSRPLKLPVIGGGGFCPGVDLDDNARTLELIEQDRDEALSRDPAREG